MGIQFDGTISIGTMIEVVILVAGWTATVTKINGRLKTVESNQEKHDTKLDNLAKISDMQSRFDERMAAVRRELDDLKRGRGFIRDDFRNKKPAIVGEGY